MTIACAAEEQLTGREFAVETAEILRLAHESGCSAYDCEFVALGVCSAYRWSATIVRS